MEFNATLLETRWFQAENCLWLFDATGTHAMQKPGIQNKLVVSIARITPELRFSVINKGNRIAILLPQHAARNKEKSKDSLRAANPGAEIQAGQLPVTAAELAHGVPVVTRLEGTLVDPSRQFNPRWFARNLLALDSAQLEQNAIGLFRHTQATLLNVGGSVCGHLQLESGDALPWALLSLSLQLQLPPAEEGEDAPPPAPIILVQAQANQFGDFVLPLNELPAAEFDMPVPRYRAQLRVQRCAIKSGLPDPDDVQNLDLLMLEPENDNVSFVAVVDFLVKPGERVQLHSHQRTALLVKPSG